MTQVTACEKIYYFISDMDYCRFGSEDDVIYDLGMYAAECLIDEIFAKPNIDPVTVATDFKIRMEDYAAKGEEAEKIFGAYAEAANDILEYYLYE